MSPGSLVMETRKSIQVYEHMESEMIMRPMMCTALQRRCLVIKRYLLDIY